MNTTTPAFTTMGRLVAARVTSSVPTDMLARQQQIENHLSAALHLVRTSGTIEGYSKAVGRAVRAASLLKQSCGCQNGGAL